MNSSDTKLMNENLESDVIFQAGSSNSLHCQASGSNEKSDIPPQLNSSSQQNSGTDDAIPESTPVSYNGLQENLRPERSWNWNRTINDFKRENELNINTDFNGIVTIQLDLNTRVDVTVNNAIRISNESCGYSMAVSGDNFRWAFKHPCGQVTQMSDFVNSPEDTIDILINSPRLKKFARIFSDKIIFSCERSDLIHKTDVTGTTSEKAEQSLLDFGTEDYTKKIITDYSSFGIDHVRGAKKLMSKVLYYWDFNGNQRWIINNIKIMRRCCGQVRIWKGEVMRLTVGSGGKAGLYVGKEKCTASHDNFQKHLFVESGPKNAYFDGQRFTIRYGTRKAGFDSNDQFRSLS